MHPDNTTIDFREVVHFPFTECIRMHVQSRRLRVHSACEFNERIVISVPYEAKSNF